MVDIAIVELSTGAFRLRSVPLPHALDELVRLHPSELIHQEEDQDLEPLIEEAVIAIQCARTPRPGSCETRTGNLEHSTRCVMRLRGAVIPPAPRHPLFERLFRGRHVEVVSVEGIRWARLRFDAERVLGFVKNHPVIARADDLEVQAVGPADPGREIHPRETIVQGAT